MALTFDGNTDNYAEKTIAFSADKGTVMGWVRLAVDTNTYASIFQCNNNDNEQFVLETGSDGTTLGLYTFNGSQLGSSLTPGTWYHMALTWNGTLARAYLNGVLNITNSNVGSDWTQVQLGRSYWGEPLNGNIAYVKAWDATLSLAQIQAEVNVAAAVKTSNLVGQWLTPSGSGRLLDSSGNGNHFTEHGSITDYANPFGATHGRMLRAGSVFL